MTKDDKKKNPTKAVKAEKVSKSEKGQVEYNYSVNLTGGAPKTKQTANASAASQPELQRSLEALRNNPQAMEMLKNALAQQKKPLTKKQAAVEKTKKFTAANIQRVLKSGLQKVDLLMNYIIKKDGPDRNDLLQQARPPILFGLWVAFFTFIVAGLWSGFAPLDSSSHATGFVVPTSKKQVIQHKEGGILEKIYVTEGSKVEAAAPLAKLSDKVIRAQITGFKAQKKSLEKQLSLTTEQLQEMNKLFAEGFVQKEKIIQLQSREADIIANLSEAESRIISVEESLERLVISSPISGTVNQVQFHTIGAVVPQGGTLMTITPEDDNLIVEAYVRPDDIDMVYIGLKAKIRISAFKHRSVAPLEGVVSHISSDVVEAPQYHQSQESMILQQQGLQYRVKIEIDKSQLSKISKYRNYELHPGMMADVMIVTGERTVLQYLIDPITSTFWHAFVEK
jgi:multidrug efflux pump subunit AcrA (membrane-fusion protein)